MARVLFAVPPLVGHVNPALATAGALSRRGHTVAWAAPAGYICEHLPAEGTIYALDGWENGQFVLQDRSARGLESITQAFGRFAEMAAATFAPMVAAVRAFQPDVMAVDQQMLSGALAARHVDVPWATLVTTSASVAKPAPPLDAWLEDQWRRLQETCLPGTTPVLHPDLSPGRVIVFSSKALVDPAMELLPADYRFVGPAGGNGRRDVPFPWEWLDARRPLVLASLGTRERDERAAQFFRTIMAAVTDMDVQVVIVADESLSSEAPANVLVRSYVPQLALLDRAAAVIGHGGHNTVCEALSRGLPLAIAPVRVDQPTVARQVVSAGAGVSLRYGKLTVATARAAIMSLLNDPELRAGAARLAAAFAETRGAEAAADELEGMV
ncbi:Zeaxanthin glucosyl transferase [Labilithrix luteola]|uniref:Zeaxanthin glucosyl transferase n=1 Tax=Labilithrix luteola TaxID=1391654 RepID=A0A0K1PNH2_9BACT|nr:nucleotide disphospho-sugar-binding domain-containing protein [Labilithrix luteola]AKU95090.1 Zeaxanthin glucosyl transferase [Labilithrix luteola]